MVGQWIHLKKSIVKHERVVLNMVDLSRLNGILNKFNTEKLSETFLTLAGSHLAECSPMGIKAIEDIESMMSGNNKELTEEYLLDSLIICTAERGEEINLVGDTAKKFARIMGLGTVTSVSLDEQRDSVYGTLGLIDSDVESNGDLITGDLEKVYDEDDWNPKEDYEGEDKENYEGEAEVYEEQESKKTNVDELTDKILNYYSSFCTGTISELIKRYTGLFSSGYEVNKPDGILCNDGIIKLSGTSRVVSQDSVATHNMYQIFVKDMGFEESQVRSVSNIASAMYRAYRGNGKVLYFPNKLLEIAYGLKGVKGNDQNSLNTYEKHASSSNWSAYVKDELEKAVKNLVKISASVFVKAMMQENGLEDYRDNSIAEELQAYLLYMMRCLSTCILMVDYKVSKVQGETAVTSFKVRVCDPDGALGTRNYTTDILEKAFLGGVGDVPFSYDPRIESEICIKEYAHEFNHNISQAMPLFAYKALQALQEQGVELAWQALILGMAEDGSILRNGTHGINIMRRLTHHICAGSRAGKGVMTLAILACAIASGKLIYYIDRKPDMASVLKYLSPDMFVINGGGYQTQYDTKYKQFTNLDDLLAQVGHVPNCALEAFQTNLSWDELGDIVYMRAVKLVIGIIVARGEGRFSDPNFGGENGILLVVDEFKNFQDSFSNLLNRVASIIPPTTIDKDKEALNKGSVSEAIFRKSYNDANFYALSYMNSLADDMKFLSEKTDAGFNQKEVELSDIFVIGQNLSKGMCDRHEFEDAIRNSPGSSRYRSAGGFGLKGFHLGNQSVPYSLVSFKTCDAFFGRNMDDGRSKYLAQTDPRSKARGRLDDKASNFAYMETFTEEKRNKIDTGTVAVNVELANSCTYFKPFLILNTGDPGDDCVRGVIDRCYSNGGITEEELIAENPDPSGIGMNRAIGFEEYLKMAGVTDIAGILAQSSKVANYVVQECLHYPGTWFELVTDLRPEWMFTIRDISEGAKGVMPKVCTPVTNPVLEEFVKFNPNYFGSPEDVERYTSDANDVMGQAFSDNEDYTDFYKMLNDAEDSINVDMYSGSLIIEDDDEEIDLIGDIEEGTVTDSGFASSDIDNVLGVNGNDKVSDPNMAHILDLIEQLKGCGINIQIGEEGWEVNHSGISGGHIENGAYVHKQTDVDEYGESIADIDYSDDIVTLEKLIHIVTNNIISKFGGLERFRSFKVIGGSIFVNGYCYRCKISKAYAKNIPYDIRRDINSGNISKLFDYSAISSMRNISDLEFDSVTFMYDYVSEALGIRGSISIDKFFEGLPTLRRITVGKTVFTRDSYREQLQEDDLFYKPKKAEKIANMAEKTAGDWSKKSWDFAKKTATNKNYHGAIRVLGAVGAGTAAAGTKVAEKGIKFGKAATKGLGAFARGVKDLFNT